MSYKPKSAQEINQYNGLKNPSIFHADDNWLNAFYFNYLFKKVMSIFEWTLPEDWDANYFQTWLLYNGYVSVIDTDAFGVIPQKCTLQGLNIYNLPSEVLVTNHLLPEPLVRKIGVDCTLIQLQPDYTGIVDIVSTYSNMMATAMTTVGTSLINSKLAYLFIADNKAAAETFKKVFDQIASGQPMAVVDEKVDIYRPDGEKRYEYFMQNLKQNYIAGDVLNDLEKIENQFNTIVGIPNGNTQKRERLITDEVNANNVDTRCMVDLWLDTLQKGIKAANKKYGLNIAVKYRYDNAASVGGEANEGL